MAEQQCLSWSYLINHSVGRDVCDFLRTAEAAWQGAEHGRSSRDRPGVRCKGISIAPPEPHKAPRNISVWATAGGWTNSVTAPSAGRKPRRSRSDRMAELPLAERAEAIEA